MSEQKKKFICKGDCGREFGFGEWECFPGQPHKVEQKTYYLADAPFMSQHDRDKDPNGILLRKSRTEVHVIPELKIKDGDTGELRTISHPPLVFAMGQFTTDNPMQQFYLERSKFPVSYERWFDVYHTAKQKQNIKDGNLIEREREIERKEKEVNDLLAQVKAKQGGKQSA